MLEKKADFILEYQERTGNILKKADVDWTQSKVVFISPAFNSYQKNSVKFRDVPFELWEIRKYGNDLIALEQHKPTSKESIEKFSAVNTEISTVSSEVKVLDESDHIGRTSPECLAMWQEIKEYFAEFADTNYGVKKHYISIKRDNYAVCFVHFKKHNIVIGDKVKITDGVFVNFVGTVIEVFHDKGRLSVMVAIFGRETRVDDLEFWQVEQVSIESEQV